MSGFEGKKLEVPDQLKVYAAVENAVLTPNSLEFSNGAILNSSLNTVPMFSFSKETLVQDKITVLGSGSAQLTPTKLEFNSGVNMTTQENGKLWLYDYNRTYLGGLERDLVVEDYTVENIGINLYLRLFITAESTVTITLPTNPQMGQIVKIFNNGLENNIKISATSGHTLTGGTVTTCEYNGGTSWFCAQTPFFEIVPLKLDGSPLLLGGGHAPLGLA